MATNVKRQSQPHPFKVEALAEAEFTPQAITPAPLAGLTLEILLYALIWVVAVTLRLSNLGAYPLSNAEAAQSLTALELYRGSLVETASYSPLLLSLNFFAFLLFGPSDVAARLATTLLGSLLVMLPFAFRRHLGPVVCLLASALLAISPVAVFLSRTLNSEIAVATAALMLVAGFFNWTEDGRQRWLWLMAGGLALLLIAGPMAYSVLLIFGLIGLAKISTFKALWARGLSQAAAWSASTPAMLPAAADGASAAAPSNPDLAVAQNSKSPPAPASQAGPDAAQTSTSLNPHLGQAGIFFVVTLLLLATAVTFNFSGVAVATSFLVDWLNHFQPQAEAGFNAIFLLTVYEPLLVLAGLIAIAYAILRKNLIEMFFVAWFVGLLVLDLVMAGRPTGNVILSLVPLAFLAAMALAELWAGVRLWGSWSNEGLIVGAGLVIAGFAYIGLTGWLVRPCNPDDTICQYSWLQAVAALALFFVVVSFFGFMSEADSALRGAALTGVAVGLLASLSIGWRLNFGPLMHLAYQPLAGIPASTGLVQLTETLADQSEMRVGDATLLDTTLVGVNSPALRWRLRNYARLTQTGSLLEPAQATAIITPATPEQKLEANEAYVGQDFELDAIWSPVGLPPKMLVHWLIYRQADRRPQGNRVILWLRLAENGL